MLPAELLPRDRKDYHKLPDERGYHFRNPISLLFGKPAKKKREDKRREDKRNSNEMGQLRPYPVANE